MDLSEAAVKQRLAGGRKLLSARIEGLVETALSRTVPSRAFTFGVLAALPMFPVSAAAATIGSGAAKSSAAANATGLLGGIGAVAGPLVGLLGAWIGVRTSLAAAQSEGERRLIIRSVAWFSVGIVSFLVVISALTFGSRKYWHSHGPQLALAFTSVMIIYVAGLLTSIFWLNRRVRRIQAEAAGGATKWVPLPARREYRSRISVFGWPLLHLNFGRDASGRQAIARGWFAAGDVAVGGIAFGGMAVGGLAFGGVSLGLLSFGGAAAGPFAFGGIAIGCYALAGIALGVHAVGGCAIALQSAFGGAALASDHALGGMAWARHANDPIARAAIEGRTFFTGALWFMKHMKWVVWFAAILLFVPMFTRKAGLFPSQDRPQGGRLAGLTFAQQALAARYRRRRDVLPSR